ncbi:hypothetical protein ACTD5D_07235 [Nocardia takedensis]|uniref:hypothetical protein n=1 Tax=Nocardia takedensis TaxID=259390 RepID=UPI000312DA0E|nr:hypothetical protein [Nocardia takedensis]
MNEDVSRWQYLAGEAAAGRLRLDSSVANDCYAAVNQQITLYSDCRDLLKQMQYVSGMGRFECADKLADMFGQKAVGGEGDVDSALAEHIEVLQLMADTIKVSVKTIEEQDQVTGQALGDVPLPP